ncbi:branched-chain amino acid ABC transporter permease [uncultured Ramlibacter sp.]|uniref:branched-chain amino acid ABC transporter permease n=1 Tax=uncultured Ramlibacter sp. TaxID=260755 RepID=UPI00262519C0|nr:branched-chain amino acid ABC transporter permease [uncultured Ramlibacter sp.]
MSQFIQLVINAIALGCIYAVVALAFEIAYESTGVVNFATGQLVTIGALLGASSLVLTGTNFAGAYVLVMLGMAVVGLLFFVGVFMPLRRQPAVTIIVGTVAVGIAVQNVAQLVWGSMPVSTKSPVGSQTLALGGVMVSVHTLYVIGVAALLILGVYLLLYRSALGSQFRALAQDPEAARLMGIRVNRLYALTWILVCALAGMAGLLLGPMWFIEASIGEGVGLKAFAAAIIGGFGSIPGAIIGGILVGLTETLGAAYISSAYKEAIVFALMFVFLLVRPQGLFGERISDRA